MIDGTVSSALTYDPLTRLYQLTSGTATTRWGYDGLNMIAEYNGANALLRRHVFAPGLDQAIVTYEGSTVSSTTRRFLSADERGSIIAVSDSTGSKLSTNGYDEFGIPQSPASSTAGTAGRGTVYGRFGYTGQAWLPEVGLYYYKARVYSPGLGRFLQTDPIGYGDRPNSYSYVRNDPINWVDPMGRTPVLAGVFAFYASLSYYGQAMENHDAGMSWSNSFDRQHISGNTVIFDGVIGVAETGALESAYFGTAAGGAIKLTGRERMRYGAAAGAEEGLKNALGNIGVLKRPSPNFGNTVSLTIKYGPDMWNVASNAIMSYFSNLYADAKGYVVGGTVAGNQVFSSFVDAASGNQYFYGSNGEVVAICNASGCHAVSE